MPVTALYAGLLALLYLVLSFRTIAVRRSDKVEIGDGGNKRLLRRIRVHANFAEYVPIALILMALAESMAMPGRWLHVIGAVLLIGRLAHAYGLSQEPHNLPMRTFGMMATFAAILGSAVACIAISLVGLRYL